jgi:hypothetical protein
MEKQLWFVSLWVSLATALVHRPNLEAAPRACADCVMMRYLNRPVRRYIIYYNLCIAISTKSFCT